MIVKNASVFCPIRDHEIIELVLRRLPCDECHKTGAEKVIVVPEAEYRLTYGAFRVLCRKCDEAIKREN